MVSWSLIKYTDLDINTPGGDRVKERYGSEAEGKLPNDLVTTTRANVDQ